MNLYSSGKHAHLTADPHPWLEPASGSRYLTRYAYLTGERRIYAPRPEFNRPLTNPANPALAMFRQMHGGRKGADLERAATAWASSLMHMSLAGSFTIHEAKHARAVLQRLANLTTETESR